MPVQNETGLVFKSFRTIFCWWYMSVSISALGLTVVVPTENITETLENEPCSHFTPAFFSIDRFPFGDNCFGDLLFKT